MLTYKIVFDGRDGSPTIGKMNILTSDPNVGQPQPTDFAFEITSPLGVVIKSMSDPYGFPDVSGSGATAFYDIPRDANGAFLCGSYTFRVIALQYVTGQLQPNVSTQTVAFNFCPVENNTNKANMTVGVSYATALITLRDLTNLTGLTNVLRSMTITPPSIPSVTLLPETTTTALLAYTFTYTGVTYIATLRTLATLLQENGNWELEYRFSILQMTPIEINAATWQSIKSDVDDTLKTIEESLCKTLKCDCSTTIRYMKITRLFHKVQMSYFEGDVSSLDADLTELYRLLGISQPTNVVAPYLPIL